MIIIKIGEKEQIQTPIQTEVTAQAKTGKDAGADEALGEQSDKSGKDATDDTGKTGSKTTDGQPGNSENEPIGVEAGTDNESSLISNEDPTGGSEVEDEPLPTPSATPSPTPTPVELIFEDKDDYVETKSDVNLRVGPSTDTDIVTNLKTAKRIKRTGYNEKWTRVVYEDKECYIYTPLVTGVFEEPTEDGNATGGKKTGTVTLTQGVGTPNGHIVCIDPGHQTKGNSDKEPLGPGSSEMKAKVSSGTSGNTTGHPEYKLNLTVSLKLRDELVARGYTVVMTRDVNDVDISNSERAKIAADAGAQAFVRIHANSSTDTSVNGVETICMTNENKYNGELYASSRKLSDAVLNNVVSSTGAKKRYVWETDTMTGINWAEGPVTILEMGYMSNKEEEEKLLDDDYQNKIVLGIADGIDEYFK
ncbi:MAG: N-acetylmuramoyl-L-alanine amidase [Lachnospiraceae bacterium]|nr:N-acetylmuramoyl-L-alanine amidase [Lachnospiraceae bacterium]